MTTGLWLGYVVGASIGALSMLAWGTISLSASIALLILILIVDLTRPAALGDTGDEEG